ncbi:hypothetical protein HNQ58_001919 [Rehaibacterium terrae]|jgi:hypothetical protein|uniref:Uncharacterized protein n=1 Tax=Rehaibacterium terrae TaxID=1341696 RepID=A0A7W8DF79_9GAMM|nr:hypothetical protein [Rehaibacterium terrae]
MHGGTDGQFISAMERIDYTVYVHRPDLSTPR